MSKPQIVKCRKCKKEIDKLTAYSPSGKKGMYYCNAECAKPVVKPPKPSSSTPTDNTWRELLDYINILYNKRANFPMLTAQIKKMKNDYKFTNKGIELTLKYCYEIEGMNFNPDNGIGIVPYHYHNAGKYYNNMRAIKKATKDFEFNNEIKIIKKSLNIKPIKRHNIDISEL